MDALPLQKSQNSMTELINLLDDIKKTPVDELDSAPSTDLAKTFLSRFDIIYADPSFRHSYSILSKNLGSYAPDERDSLPVWIARIDQLASMREENDTNKRISRDEKSRTFSSNSKRSHILRTSSRSIRLILSSIVSLAVSLKWTRTI